MDCIVFYCVFVILILFFLLKYLYLTLKEDRYLFKKINDMIDRRNKILIDSFEKSLIESIPIIIDLIKEKK
jgi:hypothetical protein